MVEDDTGSCEQKDVSSNLRTATVTVVLFSKALNSHTQLSAWIVNCFNNKPLWVKAYAK